MFKLRCKRHYRNLATYSWCTTWREDVTKTAPARRRHSVGGGGGGAAAAAHSSTSNGPLSIVLFKCFNFYTKLLIYIVMFSLRVFLTSLSLQGCFSVCFIFNGSCKNYIISCIYACLVCSCVPFTVPLWCACVLICNIHEDWIKWRWRRRRWLLLKTFTSDSCFIVFFKFQLRYTSCH